MLAKEKLRARNAVTQAIKNGLLTRLPCEVCQNPKSHAHHYKGYDRDNWFRVKFLCREHHLEAHNGRYKLGSHKLQLNNKLLKLREACAILSVHPNTLRNWERDKIIKCVRVGPRNDRRFYKQDVEQLLNKRK